MKKVRRKAEELGLDASDMKKKDLIRAIQIAEGNFPCFRTENDSCDQMNCCWRRDCLRPGWREGARLEHVKAELESLMEDIEELKVNTKKMFGKNKNDVLQEFRRLEKQGEEEILQTVKILSEASEKAWKSTRKGLDNSWEDISKSLKKLTAKF